jgi:F-type H+-transporting ATPase subunit epsilon
MVETTSDRQLQCVVVTPERAVLDEPSDFVAVPMYDGELGVLPGRAPMIGRLGYGELRSVRGGDIKRYYVDGGFVQVRRNVVTVLTPRAIRAEEIDPDAVARALEAALAPAGTPDGQLLQAQEQERSRAQLRVARRARGEAHF